MNNIHITPHEISLIASALGLACIFLLACLKHLRLSILALALVGINVYFLLNF